MDFWPSLCLNSEERSVGDQSIASSSTLMGEPLGTAVDKREGIPNTGFEGDGATGFEESVSAVKSGSA